MALIELGDSVVDRITGFQGTVTAIAKYLTGSDRALVEAFCDDPHKVGESLWIDLERLNKM